MGEFIVQLHPFGVSFVYPLWDPIPGSEALVAVFYLINSRSVAMKDIKVLGTGCAKCKATVALIEQIAQDKGVAVKLEKVEAVRDIMTYGVMSTPGVVIDGQVVHAGGVPARDKVEKWFAG